MIDFYCWGALAHVGMWATKADHEYSTYLSVLLIQQAAHAVPGRFRWSMASLYVAGQAGWGCQCVQSGYQPAGAHAVGSSAQRGESTGVALCGDYSYSFVGPLLLAHVHASSVAGYGWGWLEPARLL